MHCVNCKDVEIYHLIMPMIEVKCSIPFMYTCLSPADMRITLLDAYEHKFIQIIKTLPTKYFSRDSSLIMLINTCIKKLPVDSKVKVS